MSGPSPLERRAARLLPLLAVLLASYFLWRGWGRWPDVLVDFGRELYVPWRMSEGERLGVDLAWFNGPLSPHVNALLFRCFGVGFWTLAWANLAWLALVSFLLQRVLARVATPFAAGVALCFFLAVFACGQLVPIGNYNFVSPYSHEVTHGLGLSLAALACLVGAGPRRVRLAGVLLGLVFLTKPEFFVAGLAGLCALLLLRGENRREFLVAVGRLFAFACLPVIVAIALLATSMSGVEAVSTTLGSWGNLFDPRLTELDYYSRGMGLDHPLQHLGEMAVAVGVALLAFGPGIVLARLGPLARSGRPLLFGLIFFAVSLGVCLLVPTTWRWLARLSPAALTLLIVGGFLLRGRFDGEERRRWCELIGLAVFAFVLLGKILLQVRFGHYGFALAGPAACVLVVFLVGWVPRLVQRAGGLGACALAPALAIYLVCGMDVWRRSEELFATKDVEVGTGADAIVTDVRGEFVTAVLEQLDERLAPDDELLVLPEGVMINYLARRRTPTPYVNFMPPELILFGEAEILAALKARPPRAVVLTHKDTSEYGVPFFGRDYAVDLGAWVLDGYRHRWSDPRGGPPLTPGTEFGMSLLERRP